MSILGIAVIGIVVLLLILVGVIVGWTFGTNDAQIDILAKRLAAEHRMEQATRATLQAMRNAVRNHHR